MSVHETTEDGESLLSLACSAGYYELAQVKDHSTLIFGEAQLCMSDCQRPLLYICNSSS